MSQLAQFRKVEVLGLASSANLNVGFHPPRCGNAYMGPRGDALVKRVQQEMANDELIKKKEDVEAELSTLGLVLDSVRRTVLL